VDAINQSNEEIGILDEFQVQFVEAWRQLPNKFFFFTLFVAWLALFQFLGNSTFGYVDTSSLYMWMWAAYHSPSGDDGHGMIVPLVVVILFWWKRKELLSVPVDVWWPALGLVLLGILAHIGAYIAQFPQGSIVALFIGIYGLMGLAWGFKFLRASFFPFFLFAFCVPLGGYGQLIPQPLRILATWMVEFICHFVLGLQVIRQGAVLIDPAGRYHYEVAAACGGIRSLVAILALATVFGFIVFQSPWKRAVMIASAFPLAVLGNVTRLMTIILAAEYGGQAAGDKVHEGGPLGVWSLLPYVPAIVGLFYLERLLKRKEQPEQKAST